MELVLLILILIVVQVDNIMIVIVTNPYCITIGSRQCHALLKCNCLRKAFLSDTFSCSWALEPLILSSLRHHAIAVQCLAILLENHLIKGNEDLRSSAEAALQASPLGQRLHESIQAKRQMYTKNTSDQVSSLETLSFDSSR